MTGSSTTSLCYEGPQALIVELEREVNHGDVLLDVDDALVPKLLQGSGIRQASKSEEKKARGEVEKDEEKATDGGSAGGNS